MFFTDEKLFRVGTFHSGSNHNYVAYVGKHDRKYEILNEQVLRSEA